MTMVKYTTIVGFVVLILCINRAFQDPTKSLVEPLQKKYGSALEAIFGIGIRLQALLMDPSRENDKNFLVSPLSVALLVTQLMIGADEEFRDELYNLISLPLDNEMKYSVLRYYTQSKNITFIIPYAKLHSQMGTLLRDMEGNRFSKNFTLNCSNALFVNCDLNLKENFIHNLQIYETDLQYLNFSTDPVKSQKLINDWAAFHTNNAIKTVLPTPLPVTTSAVFTNAIYFKADWENPFSYELNIKDTFHSTKDKEVVVEYMRGNFENVLYAESDKLRCKLLILPYKGKEWSMYFILPNENNGEEYNIRKFSENTSVEEIVKFIQEAKPHQVSVQIPKMNLQSTISVLEPLQRYKLYMKQFSNKTFEKEKDALEALAERVGLFNSFNTSESVDIFLKEAAEDKELKITNILQQMTLTVNEKGTEAAAISTSIIDYMGGTKLFKLTRPFVFFIRHELKEVTLFWGTIIDPSQTS